MRLVLIRHAARDSGIHSNSPLNKRGQAQARELVNLVAPNGRLPQPTALLASPKRRARETLKPLGESVRISVSIDPRLDERGIEETSSVFRSRVESVIEEMATLSDGCVYLCSHLDWLEMALEVIPCDIPQTHALGWSPAEYRSFELQPDEGAAGIWCLREADVAAAKS